VIIVALVLALWSIPVARAQNDPIPPCDASDIIAIGELLPTAMESYSRITNMISEGGIGAIEDAITELDNLQQMWWTFIAPELPECAFSVNTKIVLSRLFDEMLISLLLLDSGRYDSVEAHTDAISASSNDLFELSEYLEEYVD